MRCGVCLGHVPVSERTLKKEDLPTLGRPGTGVKRGRDGEGTEHTYDTDLQVVTWATEEGLFLCCCLFRGHFLFSV